VTDQQIRAGAHHLPPDQQEEQAVRDHHGHHRGGEQGDESVVRRRALVQVAERVDLDAGRDHTDDREHHDRQVVGADSEADGEVADR
jgi:hypothetical protein